MIFTEANKESLEEIKRVITSFSRISGLFMNQDKLEIFFSGCSSAERSDLLETSGLSVGSLPVRYLGVPLSPSRVTSKDFQPLIDKIKAKVANWTTKFLSSAGKIQLIASVIYGPLIEFIGHNGPSLLRIPRNAKVNAACRGGGWYLPGARSDNIQRLHETLSSKEVPTDAKGSDIIHWKQKEGLCQPLFRSGKTWMLIRESGQLVAWYQIVWFKLSVPRLAFILWEAILERLPTKDRLMGWGISHDATCLLCGTRDESHHHLFFSCDYSSSVWLVFSCEQDMGKPAR
ncbi:PREDICTED: uncharacterized protein LOC109116418 [Tarenaya hassleriana]|uniref:uncharacterized protein LOC109116418 n=1 Tax=Tarenaya hassleriana TaxID=28532 RepID=UPI0008FD0717|nr:PREDICTED: uncharacterized protein LOC109116418 [Tarenaya hassleriana]